MRSEATLLLDWLRALPNHLVVDDLSLSLYFAEALLVAGELEAVEPYIALSKPGFRTKVCRQMCAEMSSARYWRFVPTLM